jgi:protein-tyrosine phosphatase
MKILMVCLGNICRSPLAEGVLKHIAKQNNIDLTVDSCGTAAYHIDSKPDLRSIAVAKKYGINISDLKGRQFDLQDFNRFHRIYTMDRINYSDILKLAIREEDKAKVRMMLETLDGNLEVTDPYYGGDEGFETVYKMLETACTNIVNEIKANNE